jgi:hypothetical protein
MRRTVLQAQLYQVRVAQVNLRHEGTRDIAGPPLKAPESTNPKGRRDVALTATAS